MLTSFTEKEMIQGALDAGARRYMLKNVKGRELIDAILGEMNDFTRGAPDQDDITLVVLSRRG